MELGSIVTLAIILILLVMSALFSGSETAFTAASRAFVARRAKEGSRNAKRLARLNESKDRFIAALLIGNNFVNTTATALASGLLIAWFGENGVVYASLAMTVVLVLFAEVMPKTYALQRPDETALKAAPFLSITMHLMGPVASMVNWVLRIVFRLLHIAPVSNRPGQVAEELQGLIDIYGFDEVGDARDAAREERQMLRGVLALDDMTVADVMTQRRRMVGLNASDGPRSLISQLSVANHARLPLWGESRDEVIGILDTRAVLRALQAADYDASAVDLAPFLSKPLYVPETRPLRDQLHSFRTAPLKIALVVDEHGAIVGLVTLEDIVEVVVGQIAERGQPIITNTTGTGVTTVRGDTRIRDVNRALDWDLPGNEAETIGGLLVRRAGQLPPVDARVEIEGFAFRILERHGFRIDDVEIRRIDTEIAKVAD